MLEPLLNHRVHRFTLPWTALLVAVLLATVTAVVAAWWPARAAARIPVVAALSARPAPPRPAHRFAALGAVLLAAGLTALSLAEQSKVPYILGGVLATAVAVLLLAPVGIATIGRLAAVRRWRARLAMRDLARYRARSGAALAAIALAVGIAAAVALTAAVSVAKASAPTGGNLPADQLIVWQSRDAMAGSAPIPTATQAHVLRTQIDTIARDLHARSVLPLTGAVDPNGPVDRDTGGRPPTVLGRPHPPGPGDTLTGSRSCNTCRFPATDPCPTY